MNGLCVEDRVHTRGRLGLRTALSMAHYTTASAARSVQEPLQEQISQQSEVETSVATPETQVPVSHSILTQSTSSPIANGRRAMPVYCSAQTLGCSVDLRGNMQGCQQPEVRHARSTDDASIMHGSLALHPRFTCKTYVGRESMC